MHTIRKAASLTAEFFGVKSLVVGAIPVIFWVIKYASDRKKDDVGNVWYIGWAYLILGSGVFVWKILEARKITAHERELEEQIADLSIEAQKSLRVLALKGEGAHGTGQGLDEVAQFTNFLDRDMTGPYILPMYRAFLSKWAKKKT